MKATLFALRLNELLDDAPNSRRERTAYADRPRGTIQFALSPAELKHSTYIRIQWRERRTQRQWIQVLASGEASNAWHHPPGHDYDTRKFSMRFMLTRVGWMPLLDGATFSSSDAARTAPGIIQPAPRRLAASLPRTLKRRCMRGVLVTPAATQPALTFQRSGLNYSASNLTPGITRRDEPLLRPSPADESNAIRGRVHAVVRWRTSLGQRAPPAPRRGPFYARYAGRRRAYHNEQDRKGTREAHTACAALHTTRTNFQRAGVIQFNQTSNYN